MHGGMTPSRPTGSPLEKLRMIGGANENSSGTGQHTLVLRMATQTKIRILLHEHFLIGGPVRIVAGRATFPHRFVFKYDRPGLLTMTGRATFIYPRHGEAGGGFEDIAPVRIVTLHAIHFAFHHGMMLRKVKFRMGFQMTLKTGARIFARIDN